MPVPEGSGNHAMGVDNPASGDDTLSNNSPARYSLLNPHVPSIDTAVFPVATGDGRNRVGPGQTREKAYTLLVLYARTIYVRP